MKIAGIVTEYNPFHLGHEYQLIETKKRLNVDYILVVMSGNFVQRGEPALMNKWERTKLALMGGADLVIELPTPYASSSAELFAKGAINLLHQLNCVDYLVFGSEYGEITPLQELAVFLNNEPANYKNALHSELKLGLSYPKARMHAIKATYADANALLKGSNNILGIEYLRALLSFKSQIQPVTIKREGSSYLNESLTHVLPSATAVRAYIKKNGLNQDSLTQLSHALPKNILNELLFQKDDFSPVYMEFLYPTFRYLLETTSESSLANIYDFPLELFQRLVHMGKQHHTYSTFIDAAMSKNYTKATIQRSLTHLYLNIQKETVSSYVENNQYNHYVRILGFNQAASPLIRHIKKQSLLPVITNYKDDQQKLAPLALSMLIKENTYSNLYHLIVNSVYDKKRNDDYRQQVQIYTE